MRYMNVYLILLVVLLCNCEKNELISVVAIFRHGARGPIQSYPTSPYKAPSFWPDGYDGQLTNRAKLEHYELGKWLRYRYRNFLPERYSRKDIHVRSADKNSCLMSTEATLAGLYVPKGNQMWNPSLLWQPVPVHTSPIYQDALVAMQEPCPKYERLHSDVQNTQYYKDISRKNKRIYTYLAERSGMPVNNLNDLRTLYDILDGEEAKQLKVPGWIRAIYPEPMRSYSALSLQLYTHTREMARLKVGLLINAILDNFSKAARELEFYKFLVFCVPNMGIVSVLNSLGLFEIHYPPFSSTIIFELSKREEGTFYVNILYKNTSELLKLVLSNSTFDCAFDQFEQCLSPVALTYDMWKRDCNQ